MSLDPDSGLRLAQLLAAIKETARSGEDAQGSLLGSMWARWYKLPRPVEQARRQEELAQEVWAFAGLRREWFLSADEAAAAVGLNGIEDRQQPLRSS